MRKLNIDAHLLYKQYYITIAICLGSPSTCYKILYDTTSTHMWISEEKDESSPFISKTYKNSSMSTVFSETIETSSRYFKVTGFEVNDMCKAKNDKDQFSFMFSFICSSNITVKYPFILNRHHFDGVIGLSRGYYPYRDSNSSRFSLIDTLYEGKLIHKRIFSHKFTDNYIKGKLFLGETGLDEGEAYAKCNCIDGYDWNCRLDSISLGNATLFDHSLHSEREYIVVFDSILYGLELPSQIAIKLIADYIRLSQGNCFAINYFAMKCLRDFPLSQLPSMRFGMPNVTIAISPQLLFDLDSKAAVDKEFVYMTKLNITDTTISRFGLIVMRDYQMIFDFDSNSVGFYNETVFGWSRFTLIVISLGGIAVMLILSVLLYHDSLFRLRNRMRRSKSMTLRKNSVELLEKKASDAK